jgi:uncharacterized repeat protein (TIGR03803 family)
MNRWKTSLLACVLFAATAISAKAQTFTTLAYYGDGFSRFSSFVQGRDGNLYGTVIDFNNGYGSVLKVTPSGVLTVLYNFCSQPSCTDGTYPGPIILATDGNFYGTTQGGGIAGSCSNYGCGTVFKITAGGAFTVLHSFSGADGAYPTGLIEGSDGNLYGTTGGGGSGSACPGCGTIFKMSSGGALSTLHNFNRSDGTSPTGLVQATDGHLYGTTASGGKYNPGFCEPYGGCGTIFKATTGGAFTSLHSFQLTDGAIPYVPVVQASDGTFYGTTFYGAGGGDGTIFSITSQGKANTVYTFIGIANNPVVGLLAASDGNLYGTTGESGSCGGDEGLVYNVSQTSVFTAVYGDACGLGSYTDTVVQATTGTFYGSYTNDFEGAFYSLDIGLAPFVTFVIPTGKPGQTAQILGQGLTGTTSVTFNGTAAASFKVVSDTYMTAVVPKGATSGAVVVTTPTGALTSSPSFTIAK